MVSFGDEGRGNAAPVMIMVDKMELAKHIQVGLYGIRHAIKTPLDILVACLSLFIMSCEQSKPKAELQKKRELDSFSRARYGESLVEHINRIAPTIFILP